MVKNYAPDALLDCAQVEGAKEEGIVYLECLKNLNGRLHFTFVGVDVCDVDETRLIVHGSDERMTEKADHLQKLIDFKKDEIPAEVIKLIDPVCDMEEFAPNVIVKVSVACEAMCMWAQQLLRVGVEAESGTAL